MKDLIIGNVVIKNGLILAPMAGVTNASYMKICKEYGAGLVCSEMVSIEGVKHNNKKTIEMLNFDKKLCPLSIQIFGNNLESYINATKYINENCVYDILDINMGCPVSKIAIKNDSGAALLKNPEKIKEIIKAVVKLSNKPVTVKLRIGWDSNNINIVDIAKICENEGISAITIHGRTRNQFFKGKSNWEWIKKVKDAVKIPVIGNGDINNVFDAKDILEKTNCDGIMIGRATHGYPWIFDDIAKFFDEGTLPKGKSIVDIKKIILKHLDYMCEFREDEQKVAKEFRKILLWYFKRIPNINKSKNINELAIEVNNKNDIIKLLNNNIYKG